MNTQTNEANEVLVFNEQGEHTATIHGVDADGFADVTLNFELV